MNEERIRTTAIEVAEQATVSSLTSVHRDRARQRIKRLTAVNTDKVLEEFDEFLGGLYEDEEVSIRVVIELLPPADEEDLLD